MLVRREAGVADADAAHDRWSMDHIFFDDEAVPTIVEVKRSTDTRIRREVVGQMLDYAANAVVYLPPDRLRGWFEDRCASEDRDPVEVMAEAFGRDVNADEFWARAATNLQAGKIRMLFVADTIPAELRRIVEFLNEQMAPADVLAIEVVQYVGEGIRTLVPKTYGRTERSETTKSVASARPKREWDLPSFREALLARGKPNEVKAFDAIVKWAEHHGLRFAFGKGANTGSLFFMRNPDRTGPPRYTFSVWTNGGIGLELGYLKNEPAFAERESRLELIRRLNTIPGVAVDEAKADTWPGVKLQTVGAAGPQLFTAVYDWVLSELSHGASPEVAGGAD
jgi:hypothetical protein